MAESTRLNAYRVESVDGLPKSAESVDKRPDMLPVLAEIRLPRFRSHSKEKQLRARDLVLMELSRSVVDKLPEEEVESFGKLLEDLYQLLPEEGVGWVGRLSWLLSKKGFKSVDEVLDYLYQFFPFPGVDDLLKALHSLHLERCREQKRNIVERPQKEEPLKNSEANIVRTSSPPTPPLRDGRRPQSSLNVHAEPFVPATRMVGPDADIQVPNFPGALQQEYYGYYTSVSHGGYGSAGTWDNPNTNVFYHSPGVDGHYVSTTGNNPAVDLSTTRELRGTVNLRQKQRPQKDEVESVDKLLVDLYKLLLKEKEYDLFEALYSKRYREQVWNIVERMMGESSDYVEESSSYVEESPESYDDMLRMSERMENELASRQIAPCYAAFSSIYPISKIREYISDLARSQKRLIELEKKYNEEAWYDSISYPMAPSSVIKINEDCYPPPPDYKCELKDRIKEVEYIAKQKCNRRYFMDDIISENSPGLMSLLSLGSGTTLVGWTGTGERRIERRIELNSDTFRNKRVFVFCINVPVLYEKLFQSLINLCNELEKAGKCEIVMVARMNILADTKRAFNRLFSLFPTCLAVPYEDWDRRELIWKRLNCSVRQYQCFVYETNGLLLTNFLVNLDTGPFGAEAFPFTEKVKGEVLKIRNQLRREGSLEDLLRPYESRSPAEVYEFNPPHQQQMRPISEVIKKKHVGLYVCSTGKLIPSLRDLYLQCKEKKEDFEIVVLYLPLISGLDPHKFKEKIEREMQDQNVRRWWCLPFNNTVSLRFWGLTEDYECSYGSCSSWWEDKLIIVGTDGKILDMYGARIYKSYGHIHPFTREAVVNKKMEEVKKEQHLNLLRGSQLFRGNNRDETLRAEGLLGKNVIVFMGKPGIYVSNGVEYGFKSLLTQYKSIKEKHPEFEMVFIEYCYLGSPENPQQEECDLETLCSEMPWYVLRHDRTRSSPLAARLREFFNVQCLVGFGTDGYICSVKPLQQFYDEKEDRWEELSLDDTLEKNIHRFFYFDEYAEI